MSCFLSALSSRDLLLRFRRTKEILASLLFISLSATPCYAYGPYFNGEQHIPMILEGNWWEEESHNIIDQETDDVDGDGDMDIIVATENSLHLIRQESPGTFSDPELFFSLWGNPPVPQTEMKLLSSIKLLDIDLDGDMDLVACVSHTRQLYVFRNNGSSFENSPLSIHSPFIPYEPYDMPGKLELLDWNSDGLLDVVALFPKAQKLSVFLRVNLPSSAPLETFASQSYEFVYQPRDMGIGDLNGDGEDELIISKNDWDQPTVSNTSILWSDTTSGYSIEHLSLPLSHSYAVELADATNDGNVDIIFASQGQPNLEYLIFSGTGTGAVDTTQTPTVIEVPQSLQLLWNFVAVDNDNDGSVHFFGFSDHRIFITDPITGESRWSLRDLTPYSHVNGGELADIDGNGTLDVIAPAQGVISRVEGELVRLSPLLILRFFHPECGDANGDLSVNIADAMYLLGMLFSSPDDYPQRVEDNILDVNGSFSFDLADPMALLNYLIPAEGQAPTTLQCN